MDFPYFTFQSGSIQIRRYTKEYLSRCYFTFQSGSIQMSAVFHPAMAIYSLYIPIWFYSNEELLRLDKIYKYYFTFQSGSIQIGSGSGSYVSTYRFTFQSGSIQILITSFMNPSFHPLHSNLVLFKYNCDLEDLIITELYIPIWFYSN